MASGSAESLIDDMKAYLTTNLAAQLALVDARYSTALDLEDIALWRVDDPVTGDMPDAIPVGWIVAPRMTIENWGQTFDMEQVDLVIWVLLRDQDPQALRRRCYRTILAIWEVLKQAHYDGGFVWSLAQGLEQAPAPEMDFGEILTAPGNMLLADARIRVQLSTLEAD